MQIVSLWSTVACSVFRKRPLFAIGIGANIFAEATEPEEGVWHENLEASVKVARAGTFSCE